MANEYFKAEPDARYLSWVKNFEAMQKEGMGDHGLRQWQVAMDLLFTATSSYAHVLSGDMKRSGRVSVEQSNALTIVGEMSFGAVNDPKVDYTIYELRRGGSHDFIARGASKTRPRLEKAVGDAIKQRFKELF